MDGHGTIRPGSSAKRLLAWLDNPAAAWITLCGVLLILTAYGSIEIFLATEIPLSQRRALAASNVFAHLSYAALAPVLLHVLERHAFRRGSALRAAAWHVAAALALGGVAVLVMQFGLHLTIRPLASVEAVLIRTGRTFRNNLHDIFVIYALLAGSAATLELFRRQRRRDLGAVALGHELTAAHLEALRVRVDPHFLFNTLNVLLPLVATRPDAACDAVVRLGTLLRLGFRRGSSGLVPIRDEAEYIRCFLVLEELRVSDRLSVLIDIAPDVLDAAIPALVLKPFVEAALAAGVFHRPGAALIEVSGRKEKGDIEIRIRSSAGGAPDAGALLVDEAAISAARQRLQLAFGPRQSVTVTWSESGDLDARLRFPDTPVPPAVRPALEPSSSEALAPAPSAAPTSASRPVPLLDRPVRLAALAAGLWLAVGLYYGSQAHLISAAGKRSASLPVAAYYIPPLVRSTMWALLTPVVLLLYRRRPLSRRPLVAVPVHLLAAAASASLVVVLAQPVLLRARVEGFPAPCSLSARLTDELPEEVGTYLLLASILLFLDLARRARASELRSARLEAQLTEARLTALRTQLHPHFLFNTLNGLLPLIQVDPAAAARTLVLLGDLLRASLASDATHVVPLSSEIDFLQRYLEIEKTRFRDRLTVTFDVADDVLEAEVPTFILQPLVENALKHGVSRCPGPGTLSVSAWRAGPSLAIEVRNEAPGADTGPLPPSNGVGLSNVRSRLVQLCGGAASLETGPAGENGYRARLLVPFARSGETLGRPGSYPEEISMRNGTP
ncbi:MAG TPA: histidine kinase [Thermoanaerobaculia bacterium]|nr:histidine kinase [Thermoanaerobaculia bacterium]